MKRHLLIGIISCMIGATGIEAATDQWRYVEKHLPDSFGNLEATFEADSDCYIVHIKDAHCNPQAQMNTAEIIKSLVEQYGFSLVCMEGASNPLSLNDLVSFPDTAIRDEVSRYFVNNGSINGVEYLALTDYESIIVEGIEDKNLYRENYFSFYKSLSFRKKAHQIIATMIGYFDELKPLYYSDTMLAADSSCKQFSDGTLTVLQFFNDINTIAQTNSVQIDEPENIQILKRATALKNSIDFTQAHKEKDAVIKLCLNYASEQEKEVILQNNLKYTFGQLSTDQLYSFIRKKCDEYLIEVEEFPNLAKSMQVSQMLSTLQNATLQNDINTWVAGIKQQLDASPQARFIDTWYTNLQTMKLACKLILPQHATARLIDLYEHLDPAQMWEFIDQTAALNDLPCTFNNDDIVYIKTILSYVCGFYDYAQKRNQRIIDNTLRMMKTHNLNRCILYAGGFHTEGLTELLRDKKIAHSVITPQIGSFHEDDPYFYLLSNQKDRFLFSLEQTFAQQQMAPARGTLALESKLVPPAEAMIDASGAQAFRDQLKTFYFAGGIREALEEQKALLFPLVAPLRDEQLAQLSDSVRALLQWRLRNFADVSSVSLMRNAQGNIDLEIVINNQPYYVRDLIVARESQRPASTFYMDHPGHLVTVDIQGIPLSIFSTPGTGKDVVMVSDTFTDDDIRMAISHLLEHPSYNREQLIDTLSLDIDNPENLIDLLMQQGILTVDSDSLLMLDQSRKQAFATAIQLYKNQPDAWTSVDVDAETRQLPAPFNQFIAEQRISELLLPGEISFPALLYMLESMPQDFSATAVFPRNDQEMFVFKKEKIVGSGTYRLVVDIFNENYTQTVLRERTILLGNDYTRTIQDQLFGTMPRQNQEIILNTTPYSPRIVLNNPTGRQQDMQPASAETPDRTITWLNPDQTSQFWNEIMALTDRPADHDFTVTGGLLFGTKTGSNYIVTSIVPFTNDDLTYSDDETLHPDKQRIDELIGRYATGDIVLLGMYRNHSVNRLKQRAQPGVDRRDSLNIYPFTETRDHVTDNPIGIVFEPNLTAEQIDRLRRQPLDSDITIDPTAVTSYFYTQADGQPQVIHQEPALSVAMPGDLLIADAQRNLYIRRIKEEAEGDQHGEKEIASFRKLPKNQGFILIADPSVTEQNIDFFVRFFRSIQQDIGILSSINEIKIKSGMRRGAHLNRDDKAIELSIDILNYPKLIQYLAFPHEWNHLQLDYKEGIEEVIVLMLDLHRINELAFRNYDEAVQIYDDLTSFEDPYQGKQIFASIVKELIDKVHSAERALSPLEIFEYARRFITSDPDLRPLVGNILNEIERSYFVSRLRHILAEESAAEQPATLPGANDYIVFEEESLDKGSEIVSNVIDFSRLRVRYLSGNAFKEQSSVLEKARDLAFHDTTGYFDPRRKEIGINIGNPFHSNEDGSINHDLVLSSIIHQRTHYLLHQNKGLLSKIQTVIEQRTDLKDALITYFFAFKNFAAFKEGKALEDLQQELGEQTEEDKEQPQKPSLSEVRKKQVEALKQDPVYAPNGELDFEKILNEVICNANAYSAILYMLHKYQDIQTKLEAENQPVAQTVKDRIQTLKKFIYAPDQVLLLKMAENARKAMIGIDTEIEAAFTIPQQSTLHVFFKDDTVTDVTQVNIDAVETTAPVTLDQQPPDQNTVALIETPESIKASNAFLTTVRTIKNQAPPIPIQYTKEIAYQNAVEFYEYLRDKQHADPLTALPGDIHIVDLYLGSPGYVKDFLDHFRKIDVNNQFYKRLRYTLVSHSPGSGFLLKQLEQSPQLDQHKNIIRFEYKANLTETADITRDALLVRSFGDITLFDDVAVLEKDGEDFYAVTGRLTLDAGLAQSIDRKAIEGYIANPASMPVDVVHNLPDNVINNLNWQESRSLIDIDGFPFGYFVRSYSEHHESNRYIYHPELLKLAQQSLSSMSLKFGGYWQINGNSLGSLDRHLAQPEKAMTELDSTFLAGMMQSQGGFLLESQRRYLERKTKQKAVSTVIDELRLLDSESLSKLIPAVTFVDLTYSAQIYNVRQEPTYRSSDPFTYNRFLRDIKQYGYIPELISPELKSDPAGVDDFLYSITQSLGQQVSLKKLSAVLIETANNPDVLSQKDLVAKLMQQPFIEKHMLSQEYLKKMLDVVYTLGQNRRNFHVRAEVSAPDRTSIEAERASAAQPVEGKYIDIRKLSQSDFDAYIEEIRRDYPLLDFGDARGIANPIKGEIVINREHPAHRDDDGSPNMAEIRQTIVHEKAHMLIFSRWNELKEIANELKNRSYERNELIKLFYDFYFDEKISLVNEDHIERLRTDPLWSENGQISYERIMSELLAVVNQYQMLPTLMKRFKALQSKMTMRGKAIPEAIQQAQLHIADIYKNKRARIAASVAARTVLSRIDARISKHFLFSANTMELPIALAELEQAALPLPSTPIKTVFSDDEMNGAVTRTWESLGNGDITRGQAITRIKGLPLSDLQASLDRLARLAAENPVQQADIETIIALYTNALSDSKIHLHPTSPESYTITGSHFTYLTEDGHIILAQGYYDYLRANGELDKALAILGAQAAGISADNIASLFAGEPVESLQKNLFDQYLKNRDYVPVIEAILDLYGIRLADVSQDALQTIIERHHTILDLPGMKTHLEQIKNLMNSKAIISYKKSPVAEAFDVYAQSNLSVDDVMALRSAVLDVSTVILRETSAPVIFLLDYQAVTGAVSPQNFAIRDTLARIRSEIEQLEQRNVTIIAVDLEGKSVGAVRDSLDTQLLRKGATSDDFDYVVSYADSAELLDALRNEYPAFPEDILKTNIKILGRDDSPLITFARDGGYAYQAVTGHDTQAVAQADRGVFLIDYLRSLGLTSFILNDTDSELSRDLRSSLHITDIHSRIDTTGIPDHLMPAFDRFIQHVTDSPQDFRFEDLLDSFYVHAPDVKPQEWAFLTPYLEEQYTLQRMNEAVAYLRETSQPETSDLYGLYVQLVASYDAISEHPTYQAVTNRFFADTAVSQTRLIRPKQAIDSDLKKRGLTDTAIGKKDLAPLFLSLFIDRDDLSDSAYFVLERKIATDGTLTPVAYDALLAQLQRIDISPQTALNRYLQVEIAPKKIKPELRQLMDTQKLFDESA